ncbi:Unknown protein, partial [Striga hermonthica]
SSEGKWDASLKSFKIFGLLLPLFTLLIHVRTTFCALASNYTYQILSKKQDPVQGIHSKIILTSNLQDFLVRRKEFQKKNFLQIFKSITKVIFQILLLDLLH